MKICFSVSSFPSRSQTFVSTQVLHALACGHDVTVACTRQEPDDFLSDAARARLVHARIVLWPPHRPGYLRFLPTKTKDRLVARADRDTWRKRIDADVVIAHFGYRGAAVARAQRGWTFRPPLVTIFHGRDVSVEFARDRLTKYRDLFVQGDLHLAVNGPFAERLCEAGAPPEKVETHHLGVPTERYAMSSKAPGPVLRLLSVCRLVEKKGLAVAIDALSRLSRTRPDIDWRFDIGGDGPLELPLRRMIEAAGLTGRVSFLGPLSHQDALSRIAAADVFVLPSVTAEDGDQEGIPVTLMEAMALGTPVCTTRHSGIPELVVHGETGLLSDENDARGLCDNIAALSCGRIDARALARAGRRRVEQEFDEARQNALLLDRCRELVSTTRR